jgi:hypothetical protein
MNLRDTQMSDSHSQTQTLPFRCSAAAIAFAAVLLSGAITRTSAQHATTGEVKAAFLYNFARFTEWPADAIASESAALVIGVAGDEALRRTIDNLVRGKFAGIRSLKTRLVKNANDTAGVQILYIGGTAASQAEDFVQALNHGPVLTIGDVDQFAEKGGMINFMISDNRVRFEIRVDATEQSGLKVSSRVMTLARNLHGTSKP